MYTILHFSFGESPKTKPKVCVYPPSQNLSVHFSPLLWEISKKWPKQKNRIFRPRFVCNNDFWKILNFRPSFEFLKVCFWNNSQTKNIYRDFFSNYERSHFSATFGTKTLKIEYQDFEIWHFKVGYFERFDLYTTRSEFLYFHLYTTKSELPWFTLTHWNSIVSATDSRGVRGVSPRYFKTWYMRGGFGGSPPIH